jgi:hypothetical protein
VASPSHASSRPGTNTRPHRPTTSATTSDAPNVDYRVGGVATTRHNPNGSTPVGPLRIEGDECLVAHKAPGRIGTDVLVHRPGVFYVYTDPAYRSCFRQSGRLACSSQRASVLALFRRATGLVSSLGQFLGHEASRCRFHSSGHLLCQLGIARAGFTITSEKSTCKPAHLPVFWSTPARSLTCCPFRIGPCGGCSKTDDSQSRCTSARAHGGGRLTLRRSPTSLQRRRES